MKIVINSNNLNYNVVKHTILQLRKIIKILLTEKFHPVNFAIR
jgi:hypothetical protein